MQTSEIKEDIKKELHTTEIIISWAQLGFALFILIFWLISVYARKYSPSFEILPYALGLYAFVSLIKLNYSYKRRVSNLFLLI